MTEKKKVPGIPFKKGQSGNPKGRPRIPEDLKMIRALTRSQLKEIGDAIVCENRDKLREILSDPASSVLQVWISSVAMKSIQKGDFHSLDALLNRLIGKVKDEMDLNIKPAVKIIDLPFSGKHIQLGKEESEE